MLTEKKRKKQKKREKMLLHERQKALTYEKAKVNRVHNIWWSIEWIRRHLWNLHGRRSEYQEFRHFFGMATNLIKFSIQCTENRNFQVMQKDSNPFFKWNLNDFVRAYDTRESFFSCHLLIQLWMHGHQSPVIMPAAITHHIRCVCTARIAQYTYSTLRVHLISPQSSHSSNEYNTVQVHFL